MYWILFADCSPFGRASPHGATDSLCGASECGATVWPRWRPEPALRRDGDDVALPVAPHALARQGQCPEPAPASSPPPSLSFPHSSPTRARPGVAAGRHTPQILTNPAFWVGESWGKRSPRFPECIAPIFSSFNRAHLCCS